MAVKAKLRAKAKPEAKVKPKMKAKQVRAKPRGRPKKQIAKSMTRAPVELVFWCNDGSVFEDLRELAEGLAAMSDETFFYHSNSEKQDFANWVRDVIEDAWLADELARATSRLQAAECVANRIALLIEE
jgi:hypothetical protein